MLRNLFSAALILALSSACAPKIEYIPAHVPYQARPELERVKDEELVCLSDSAYSALARRDDGWKRHVERLEAVCFPK